MTTKNLVANMILLFASANLCGQTEAINPVAKEALSKASAGHTSYYIDPASLHLDLILSPPPARDSATTAAELTELHRIEASRTAVQVTQAKADDQEEDIFVFGSVLGPGFTAEALPITASLSAHVRKDESAASSPLEDYLSSPPSLSGRQHASPGLRDSTPSPLPIRAGIRFRAICLLLHSCNSFRRNANRSWIAPTTMSTID